MIQLKSRISPILLSGRFLQFQLTVNITAVLVTFVSAIVDANEASVLTAVQLLWVNLIMDTMAALALATDSPTVDILDRPPESKQCALITSTMWKMIAMQVFSMFYFLFSFFISMWCSVCCKLQSILRFSLLDHPSFPSIDCSLMVAY